jgi:hypothetical protein
MNWSDWEMLWRHQEQPFGAAADVAMLRQTFEAKRRKLARSLFVRDIAEAAAGVFVAGALVYMRWHKKSVGWPIVIAVALVLGVTGFFIRERIRTRRLRLGAGAPLLAKLEAEIAELQHQRRLLWNVWPWYLGPIVVAWAIVGVTALANTDATGRAMLTHPLVIGFIAGYFVLCVLLFWAVWAVNRRAVRTQLDPRLEELANLRRELLGRP